MQLAYSFMGNNTQDFKVKFLIIDDKVINIDTIVEMHPYESEGVIRLRIDTVDGKRRIYYMTKEELSSILYLVNNIIIMKENIHTNEESN